MSNDSTLYRSILVPLDGSPLAEQALPLAIRTAHQGGGKLRLALVHEPPIIPIDTADPKLFTSAELALRKAERGYLRGLQAKLRDDGTRVASAVTLTGEVGPALTQYVRELGVDLVVMATHGRGGVQRVWLGSVADHLIRNVDVPVLLVRPGEAAARPGSPTKATQLLVPLDGSALAEEALGPAAELARLWDLELNLVRVVHPVLFVTEPALPIPSSYDEGLTTLLRSQAQDYLNDQVEDLRAHGHRASGVAVVGWNSAGTILELARPERFALVALATHGRGGLRRMALGSVADKLVRASAVPVLVYRPGARRTAKSQGRGQRAASAR